MENIKVIIVDDHQIIIDGLKSLLAGHENIQVIGTAGNGIEALKELEEKKCHVIIMDIKMPEMNGIEATSAIKKKYPDVNIVALTTYGEKKLIQEIIKAGALGYILKNTGKQELDAAIIAVANGQKYYSSEVAMKLLDADQGSKVTVYKGDFEEAEVLTQREIDVLRLIANEHTTAEIGEKLFISVNTVETHRKHLIQKLNVKNVAGLVKYAIQNGYV
ncbi:MAG: response regulator transcription factor [Bacteroidia bacterium]|nr:response regulator transcription factor [Bacteroidia bacterium]